jgi:exopolysaccharide production protein ExoZ
MFIWIQVLRGLAAAMVVCHHYVASQAEAGASVSHWLLNFGGAGVDIFFVISGFIMMITQSDSARNYSAKKFLIRRLARIAPLYWVLTAAAFALVVLAASSVNTQISAQKFLMSMLFLPYSETAISMSMSAHTAYVIPMAWTLTFEWYFYLVFATSLALGLKPVARLPFIALCFSSAVIAGAVFQPDLLILQVLTSPLVFEFLLGSVVAIMYLRGYRLSGMQAAVLAAGSLAILANLLHAEPMTRTLIWGLAAFMLISAATLYDGRKRQVAAIIPFARLGDISYSLYLSHFFSLALFVRIQKHFAFVGEGFGWLTILIFIVLTLCVAELCYRFIEEPARDFFSRRRHKALGASMVAGSDGKRAI